MGGVLLDRRRLDPKLEQVTKRIIGLEQKHGLLVLDVKENTALTKQIAADTSDMVEMWKALAGGFKVLKWLGSIAKWVSYIGGGITAAAGVWWMWKNGINPPVDIPK